MNCPEPETTIKDESRPRYSGQVIYIYAFDLAYDMKRQRLEELLGQPVTEYLIEPSKRAPKKAFFHSSKTVTLPTEDKLIFSQQNVNISKFIKIFNVGAISIQVRVPFEAQTIEELIAYHELRFVDGTLSDEVKNLAEKARQELEPFCIRPVPRIESSEEYTVFCINNEPAISPGQPTIKSEDWLETNRRQVAALLTEEQDAIHLSEQEAIESTEQHLTYYETDLVVVDWDSALVIGENESLNDVIHIMELANVQLLELAVYDRLLDSSLETAYRDLASRRIRAKRQIQRNLREIRIDMARLSDELLNITKFFGDWHLARIYQYLSRRFHLSDWHKIIQEKLKTLGELYQLLQQDRVNFWMVLLELTIVLLFIIDVILLIVD